MAIPALAAARELRRAISFDASFVTFTLNRKRPNNADVQEFFDRLKRCRICVLRLRQTVRRRQGVEFHRMAEAKAALAAGQPKRHRFHIRQMNKLLKRTGHEALLFIEAFYWNASRVGDCAKSLELVATKGKHRKLDAFLVRNNLIEHEKSPLRPSISGGSDPVYKLGHGIELQVPGVYEHARELAQFVIDRMQKQMQAGLSRTPNRWTS